MLIDKESSLSKDLSGLCADPCIVRTRSLEYDPVDIKHKIGNSKRIIPTNCTLHLQKGCSVLVANLDNEGGIPSTINKRNEENKPRVPNRESPGCDLVEQPD